MKELLTPEALLTNLKDVRALTRKVIEAFPEKDLFEFNIANLRPFSAMVEEFLRVMDYLFKERFQEQHTLFLEGAFPTTKAEVLALWDRATEILDREWKEVGDYTQFTMYHMTFSFSQWVLLYAIRGQGYTYLHALNIVPPLFWARENFN